MVTWPEPVRTVARRVLPAVFVALAMGMFVFTDILATVELRRMPVAQLVWLRYSVHLLLMIVVFGGPCRLSFVRTGRPVLQIFRSLLMLAMPMCYQVAAQTLRGTTVLALLAASPLIVLGLAPAAGERVPRSALVIGAVGYLGALVLYRPALAPGWGVLAGLGIALSYSGYVVATRVLDRTEPLLTNLFYTAVGVFLALSLASPWFWQPIGLRQVAGAAAVAVSGWLALYFLENGIRRETLPRVAPFLFTHALLDSALRVLDRGRHPELALLLGSLLIFAAVVTGFLVLVRDAQPPALVGSHAPAGGTA